MCVASVHLKAAFAASGRAYGSGRLRTALQARGVALGRYRVRSLMKLHKLRPVWSRKFMHTTDSKHAMPVSSNVLDRQFEWALPNQAWVSDITYIRTRSGWLYLAAVLNLHSRKIVGWAMALEMPASLTTALTSTTACVCIQLWATCHPLLSSKNRHLKNLLPYPKLLDQHKLTEALLLCHLRYRNHSTAFWKEVDKVLPDYHERKE